MIRLLLASALAFLVLPEFGSAGAHSGKGIFKVRWGKRMYELAELEEAAGPEPARAAAIWKDWCEAHEYHMVLGPDGRILLVVPKGGNGKKQLGLVEETMELVDELLPAPERPEGAGADATNSWGEPRAPLDTETAVLLELRKVDDYVSALDHLAERHEYMRDWVKAAQQFTGFVLDAPLAGAWIQNAPAMKEWDPKNELVNRAAQLLVQRRFGALPFWLEMGLAWHFEYEVHGTVYCFPYRSEFIFATEHDGWNDELKHEYKKRDELLRLTEAAGWQRGAYKEEFAGPAWGVTRFLTQHYADELPAILEDFRIATEQKGRITHDDGSWEWIPGYELPIEDQQAILEQHVGEDALEQMSDAFRLGKSWRRPRK